MAVPWTVVLLAAGIVAACGADERTMVNDPASVPESPDARSSTDGVPAAADAMLSGSITYVQRIALPRDATVVVGLYDLSRGTAGAPLSERRFQANGQEPIRFELPYESGRIQPGQAYGVRAQILVDGALWFSNDPPVPVLTRGAPGTVQVVVRPAVHSD